MNGAVMQSLGNNRAEFSFVVSDAATRAAKRKARANNRRITNGRHKFERLLERTNGFSLRGLDADFCHRLREQLPILALLDRFNICTNQFNAVFLEHTRLGKLE